MATELAEPNPANTVDDPDVRAVWDLTGPWPADKVAQVAYLLAGRVALLRTAVVDFSRREALLEKVEQALNGLLEDLELDEAGR